MVVYSATNNNITDRLLLSQLVTIDTTKCERRGFWSKSTFMHARLFSVQTSTNKLFQCEDLYLYKWKKHEKVSEEQVSIFCKTLTKHPKNPWNITAVKNMISSINIPSERELSSLFRL